MSTPEQPASPPLTRKRMREIRNTGSNPIVSPGDAPAAEEIPSAPAQPAPWAPPAEPTPIVPAPPAPLPRAAAPVDIAPPPVADSAVDLGVSPLTRRQARQQERIRTASVPVITPDVIAAHQAAHTAVPVGAVPQADAPSVQQAPAVVPAPAPFAPEPVTTDSGVHSLFGLEPGTGPVESAPRPEASAASWAPASAPIVEPTPVRDEPAQEEWAAREVDPSLGAGLLAGEAAAPAMPPSFDQLLSQSTSGSTAVPNALIVSQIPESAPIVAPVASTGEMIITGTFALPEGLGSTGHAAGTADGKEVDAVLVDGELPAHSSPTPIAASAAVSTSKSAGEVIQPPAPEKGSKLMMSLAITAGVLALALVGVLILAFATGVF